MDPIIITIAGQVVVLFSSIFIGVFGFGWVNNRTRSLESQIKTLSGVNATLAQNFAESEVRLNEAEKEIERERKFRFELQEKYRDIKAELNLAKSEKQQQQKSLQEALQKLAVLEAQQADYDLVKTKSQERAIEVTRLEARVKTLEDQVKYLEEQLRLERQEKERLLQEAQANVEDSNPDDETLVIS